MTRSRRIGFTLLEVVIALGILVVSLVVMVEAQTTAVWMTTESERTITATMLAQEKMTEVMLQLESDGFKDQDIEEEGDFEDYEFEGMDLNFDESFEDYRWAWTIREIELSGLGDLGGVTEDLAGSGYWGEETESSDVETKDLGDMGIEPDMITDMLSAYIREVRVVVWWGENEDSVDQIEIVSQVINPSGMVTSTEDQQ